MGNLLTELTEKYAFTTRQRQGWGNIDGYWFTVALPTGNRQPMIIISAVHFPDDEAARSLDAALKDVAMVKPGISVNRTNALIKILWPVASFGGPKTQEVEGVLSKLTAAYRAAGAVPGCLNCGSDQPEGYAIYKGRVMKLCSGCQGKLENKIMQQNEEYKAVGNNYLRGTVGAVLGALIGSIAWVVIGLLGYVAAIGGLAISFCAIKGYTLMKGKVTKLTILIICLVSIVVMVLAEFIAFDIAAYNNVLKAGYSMGFGQSTQIAIKYLLSNSDAFGALLKDCLLGLLFLALGAFRIIGPLFAKAKAPAGKFERL